MKKILVPIDGSDSAKRALDSIIRTQRESSRFIFCVFFLSLYLNLIKSP